MDALSALGACFKAWGPRPATQHLARIWWALRDELSELLEPAEPAPGGGSQSTAVAAAECLRRCIAAKSPEEVDLPHSMPLDLGKSEHILLGLVSVHSTPSAVPDLIPAGLSNERIWAVSVFSRCGPMQHMLWLWFRRCWRTTVLPICRSGSWRPALQGNLPRLQDASPPPTSSCLRWGLTLASVTPR